MLFLGGDFVGGLLFGFFLFTVIYYLHSKFDIPIILLHKC